MRRHPNAYVPTLLDLMWHMGGRLLDLSGDHLDRLTAFRMAAAWLPADVDRAQDRMDGRAASC